MVSLFVLAIFIFFIVLDIIVLKIQGKTHPAFEKVMPVTGLSYIPEMELKVPGSVMLSKGHVWMRKEKSGLVRLGIDDFINKVFGNITIQNKLSIGKEIRRGDVLFEGALGNNKIKFYSPVNGIVKAINSDSQDGEFSDSYGNWNVELSAKDIQAGKSLFFAGNEALTWLKQEFIRLDNFISAHSSKPELAGVTMYDGGKAVEGAPAGLINEIAEDFEKEFLSI